MHKLIDDNLDIADKLADLAYILEPVYKPSYLFKNAPIIIRRLIELEGKRKEDR